MLYQEHGSGGGGASSLIIFKGGKWNEDEHPTLNGFTLNGTTLDCTTMNSKILLSGDYSGRTLYFNYTIISRDNVYCGIGIKGTELKSSTEVSGTIEVTGAGVGNYIRTIYSTTETDYPSIHANIKVSEIGLRKESGSGGSTGGTTGSMSSTLLWKNNYPENSFAQQTITCGATLQQFKYLKFVSAVSTTEGSKLITTIVDFANLEATGSGRYVMNMGECHYTANGNGFLARTGSILESTTKDTTNISVSACQMVNSAKNDDSYVIPLYVYGINGIEL